MKKYMAVLVAMLLWSQHVAAAPDISGVIGTIVHGQSIIISGTGFSVKATAAPIIWDDCSGSTITTLWTGGWPNNDSAEYNLGYRTPAGLGRGVALPHSHVTQYMSGAHRGSSGYDAGYNVMPWKTRTVSTYPAYSYISYYRRWDPNWVFGGAYNWKLFDYSYGGEPYEMSSHGNWYLSWADTSYESSTDVPEWYMNDDTCGISACIIQNTDQNGHGRWWSSGYGPVSGWAKIEIELSYTDQTSGYIKVWENGTLKVNYAGKTDGWTLGQRSEGLEGYSGYSNANNWRYFNDIYLDYTRHRILIGNANTLAGCTTLREVQIPSAWSDTSITATINQGAFADSATAYLYVVDSTGAANADGYPITFGATVGATPATLTGMPTGRTSWRTHDSNATLAGTAEAGTTSVTWRCTTCTPTSGSATGTTTWATGSIGLAAGDNNVTIVTHVGESNGTLSVNILRSNIGRALNETGFSN